MPIAENRSERKIPLVDPGHVTSYVNKYEQNGGQKYVRVFSPKTLDEICQKEETGTSPSPRDGKKQLITMGKAFLSTT